MEIGINANPTNGFTAQELNGVYYVRFPLWLVQNTGYNYGPFMDAIQAQGVWCQLVLDSRSFTDTHYDDILRRVKKKYPQINWIQTGQNEFDNKSESSSYATPAKVDKIITATRRVFGDSCWLTAPAVVSAQGPDKLRELKTLGLCNSLAFHPYGIRPEPNWPTPDWGFGYIGDVYALYADIAQGTIDKQVEVSEFGFNRSWFPNDEHNRAIGHSKMLVSLAKLGCARAATFCYHDVMHDDFGLIDENNVPTESYAAVWGAGPILDVPPDATSPPIMDYVQGRVVASRSSIKGAILHGTRSGQVQSVDKEYIGTVNYVRNGTDGVTGWNCTIGNSEAAIHMGADEYGWHARAASRNWYGAEFAQGVEALDVTDEQVNTFAYIWKYIVKKRFPNTPDNFITHAEAERTGLTGAIDGKTDVFSYGSARADELRTRIAAALARI